MSTYYYIFYIKKMHAHNLIIGVVINLNNFYWI